MKNVTKVLLSCAFGLFASSSVLAIPSGYGSVDKLLTTATLKNDKKVEEAWFEKWLFNNGYGEVDLSFDKTDMTENSAWDLKKDADGSFLTYDFKSEKPKFFMLKIGLGNLPAEIKSHYFFLNNDDFTKALVSLKAMFGNELYDLKFDAFRVSHLGKFGDMDVTEPTPLTLLALGLVGLGVIRIRSASRKN